MSFDSVVERDLLREEIERLERELREARDKMDEALAVVKAPDSTNDGGPADLAEEMRFLVQEHTTLHEENEALRIELSEAQEENSNAARSGFEVAARLAAERDELIEQLREAREAIRRLVADLEGAVGRIVDYDSILPAVQAALALEEKP